MQKRAKDRERQHTKWQIQKANKHDVILKLTSSQGNTN